MIPIMTSLLWTLFWRND